MERPGDLVKLANQRKTWRNQLGSGRSTAKVRVSRSCQSEGPVAVRVFFGGEPGEFIGCERNGPRIVETGSRLSPGGHPARSTRRFRADPPGLRGVATILGRCSAGPILRAGCRPVGAIGVDWGERLGFSPTLPDPAPSTIRHRPGSRRSEPFHNSKRRERRGPNGGFEVGLERAIEAGSR